MDLDLDYFLLSIVICRCRLDFPVAIAVTITTALPVHVPPAPWPALPMALPPPLCPCRQRFRFRSPPWLGDVKAAYGIVDHSWSTALYFGKLENFTFELTHCTFRLSEATPLPTAAPPPGQVKIKI